MSTGPCVLAVDLGTSGPKAAVVSAAGRIVATARAHVDTLFLPDNGAEQDPAAIWAEVKTACKPVIQLAGVTPDEILAVICSSQYSSIVPVDADGQPTMNMILWMDGRGGADALGGVDLRLRGFQQPAPAPAADPAQRRARVDLAAQDTGRHTCGARA